MDGPLLILAGPGSGKTRVITHRIAWLLENGVPGRQVLALTFTNKAAEEMKKRIDLLAGETSVWAGTFHRFCAVLLRKYAPFVGLQQNFSIYDVSDSMSILRRAIGRESAASSTVTPEAVANGISWAKNNLIPPSQYAAKPGHLLGAAVAKAYPAYQAALLAANAVDFDDLLFHAANVLRENPEVRAALDERYRYILVDEYQDTNLAQYAIARALSVDHPNLAVTGDPDQSIYGWRGANLNNILEFERDYPSVRVVRLERNYRSTKRILRAASELIAHNVRRKQKGLFTENDEGAPVRLTQYGSNRDEAECVAARIADDIYNGRRRPRDFAVFYRVNALSREFELALRRHGVPFQLIHSVEFFQRKEIKDLIAYLHLVNNPRDEAAFLRVINTPARGIGKTTVSRLQDFSYDEGISLLDAARMAQKIPQLTAKVRPQLARFAAMIDRLGQFADAPIEELLGNLLAETNYKKQFQESEDPNDMERLANIEELLTAAREFDERHGGGGHTLEEFLEETALVGDTDDWESEGDRVTLMTLHASKGLEFPVVFIVAVEEGLLPHQRSRDSQNELEEERRLAFVGITRACEELQLSYARYRDFRGQRKSTIPSSFLMELPRGELIMESVGEGATAFSSTPTAPVDAPTPSADGPVCEFDEAALANAAATIDVCDESIHEDTFSDESAPQKAKRAGEGARSRKTQKTVTPDDFAQDMVVEHPQYGRGVIVALSGIGPARQATVDFDPPAGRMRFILMCSPLKPA